MNTTGMTVPEQGLLHAAISVRAHHQGPLTLAGGHWVLTVTTAMGLETATLYEVPKTFASMWTGLQRLRQNEKHVSLASLYALCC